MLSRGKLGKKPARKDHRTLQIARYLRAPLGGLPAPRPGGVDWGAAVRADQLALGMLGNDQYGDCFWAMAAHAFMTWNANAGRKVEFTTDAVLDAYCAYLGIPRSQLNDQTDNGTVMLDGLKFLRTTGIKDSAGNYHKIGAFAAVNPKDQREVQVALDVFGELLIGVEFPQSWMDATIWDVTASPIEGGHAINGIARDLLNAPAKGINIDTWGTDDRWITWPAIAKYCDEMYVTIPPDWLQANGKAPSGFDAAALQRDLDIVQAEAPAPAQS
ncbi:MAG TPA: hypothetical protein VFB15_11685 [Candidatus Binataceae bacterium]|jgi:hypothetical protein|nr:hypothetical protein [Candidatus Binataceae bacterium]